MFEYINPGFYIISGIILFLMLILFMFEISSAKSEKRKIKISMFAIFTTLFVIIAPLYVSMDTKSSIKENLRYFNNGITLECSTLATDYLVSKTNGWEQHRDGFVKDSLLIRADKCKEECSYVL